MKLEHRAFTLDELTVERRADTPPRIRGHAAVFNLLSDPIWDFRERIQPGAFAKTLNDGADVRALFNHNADYVLGRTKSGTLSLSEDDRGLAIDIAPPDTTFARDLMTSIERRDIDQMSFGFSAVRETWTTENDQLIRDLVEVRLFDVSPVTFPAYPQTDVSVRSAMAEAGVNWDAVSSAMARSERSFELTEKDHYVIRSAIEALNHYLPAAPSQGAHPAEGERNGDPQGRIMSLRRRLELVELEV